MAGLAGQPGQTGQPGTNVPPCPGTDGTCVYKTCPVCPDGRSLSRQTMNNQDQILRQGACAALELAARRSPAALETAWRRFTPKQRSLVPVDFIEALRAEAQDKTEVAQ